MSEEKSYRVTWEIDLDATSPEVAALRAQEVQMDPESTATIFVVREHFKGGSITIDTSSLGGTDE